MNAQVTIHCEGDYRRAQAEIRRLNDLVEQLQYEVQYYKREAGLLADADCVDLIQEKFAGLTPPEAVICAALYQRREKWLPGATLEGLLDEERGHPVESNVIAVMISKLRKKLGEDAIETLRSRGYRLSSRALSEFDRKLH